MLLRQGRRRFLAHVGGLCSAFPFAWHGFQDSGRRVRRIGYINGGPQSLHDAFTGAMRALGYIEGQNLFLEKRVGLASGSTDARQKATELATSDLELVVAGSLPYALD